MKPTKKKRLGDSRETEGLEPRAEEDEVPLPRHPVKLPARPAPIFDWWARWVEEPQAIERLVIVRVLAPLAILGFLSGRAAHADEWLGGSGFRVPDHGGDWRQPIYIPALPIGVAWAVAVLLFASGLSLVVGFRARLSALLFSMVLIYVALADRLAAFTVSKIGPAVAIALAASACGARYSVDAWLAARKNPAAPRATLITGGAIRFFQGFLAVFYASSGICKARGDWLTTGAILYSHMHDSYQTALSYTLARVVPTPVWTVLQGVVLAFELFAPIWFGFKKTRIPALIVGLGMHTMIALMFGPVRWFSLLMIGLLLGAYLPEGIIQKLARRAGIPARRAKLSDARSLDGAEAG